MKTLLTINGGSSSIKFALYTLDVTLQLILRGDLVFHNETIEFSVRSRESRFQNQTTIPCTDNHYQQRQALALNTLITWIIKQLQSDQITVMGHRIVHGGATFQQPVEITEAILKQLEKLNPLAPLHQPYNLAAVRALQKILPAARHIACFDTAFHATQNQLATVLPIPYEYFKAGIRRYGFHGLSYEYIAKQLPIIFKTEAQPERVIVAHLGNGSSLCALRHGKSVATSMGFSALDGVPMATRSGAIDPGVVLYFCEQQSVAATTDLLYHHSGLLGISGKSADMRELLAAADEPQVQLALDYYALRVAQEIAALATILGGVDCMIFTGGIGEHAPAIRAQIIACARWMGLELDASANAKNQLHIEALVSRIPILVVATDEEIQMASHALTIAGQ